MDRLNSWSATHPMFYGVIAPRIRAQMVTAGRTIPNTLDELVESLDEAYWEAWDLTKNTNSESKDSYSSKAAESSSKSKRRKHDSSNFRSSDSKSSSNDSKARVSLSSNSNNNKSLSSCGKKKDEAYKKYCKVFITGSHPFLCCP